MSARTKLTISMIRSMPPGAELWDSEVPGFGIRSRARTKSFFVWYRNRTTGEQRRLTIGRFGRMTPEQARREAQIVLGDVERLLSTDIRNCPSCDTEKCPRLISPFSAWSLTQRSSAEDRCVASP
ncbi:MAG: DUF4102 domain-containing protein [Pseudorhodoplanes sp.]|nr:DUF4102 domain-containing protein [Pseudorhodoplanes sp.]